MVSIDPSTVPVESTTDNVYASEVAFTPKRIFPSSVDPAGIVPIKSGFARFLAYWEVIAVRRSLVDLYESTNEESLNLNSFFLSLFLIVISRISIMRPGLPIPFPSDAFFTAELRVTVKTSVDGAPVVEMAAAGAVAGACVAMSVSGMVVGLTVYEGVVRVGELPCAGAGDCVDVHPVLTMHAVSTIINTEQMTDLFFIVIAIRLKSHALDTKNLFICSSAECCRLNIPRVHRIFFHSVPSGMVPIDTRQKAICSMGSICRKKTELNDQK